MGVIFTMWFTQLTPKTHAPTFTIYKRQAYRSSGMLTQPLDHQQIGQPILSPDKPSAFQFRLMNFQSFHYPQNWRVEGWKILRLIAIQELGVATKPSWRDIEIVFIYTLNVGSLSRIGLWALLVPGAYSGFQGPIQESPCSRWFRLKHMVCSGIWLAALRGGQASSHFETRQFGGDQNLRDKWTESWRF